MLFTVAGFVIVAGCGPLGGGSDLPAFPKGSTMARIQQSEMLTVGIKFDQPMFGYKDPSSGRIEGFDAQIARLLARDVTGSERKIRFIETVSKHREQFLREGVVDLVIATYSITSERRKLVDFAGPYYYAAQAVLVKAEEKAINEVDDLAGKRVCTVVGSTSIKGLAARVPKARVEQADVYSECVAPLMDGSIDALSTDNTILLGLMSQHPGRVRLAGRPFTKEPYGIGVRLGDGTFRDYLDERIRQYVRDGSWDRAYRATIGAVDKNPTTMVRPQLEAIGAPVPPQNP